jgi:myo-inositol 2-dehydrogenase/D-chiro-inositol 1-dehydrogenase
LELDAVTIAATASAHAGLINTCLDAELPDFCEKPVALGYEETVELVNCFESSGALLQVGFLRRFVAGYREARRLIDADALESATNRKSERPYL